MAKTIAAIATPHGVGGIGVVRLSGDRAVEIAQAVFRAADGSRLADLPGYTARFGSVAQGEKAFDQAVALVFRAPRSYTGEDVVELSVHGGLVTVERTLQAVLAAGAAPAGPGEFTKRAFLHGKMDLTEAESVADLISASGQAAADSAYTALSGALRQKIEGALDILMEVSAGMAAWVDYPDEEIPELDSDTLLKSLQQAQGLLSHLLAGYDNGQLMTAGVDTVIVGRPNVGKSALMNDLTGQDTSIVTAVQGTTRDVVERTVRLGDLTLRLADTAGLRQTDDVVEQIGVERAQARLQQARLVLANQPGQCNRGAHIRQGIVGLLMQQTIGAGQVFELEAGRAIFFFRPHNAVRAQRIHHAHNVEQVPAPTAVLPFAGIGLDQVAPE